jgi:hypothetical protein
MVPSIEAAIETAVAYALAHDMTILIAGGLFLAVEGMVALQGGYPQELLFF